MHSPLQLLVMIMKSCDISNEVRPRDVSEPWVDCLLEEYFAQSDREKLEGLPVAPFMDREKVTKATAQIGFIKHVLIPTFESVSKVSVLVTLTHTLTLTYTHIHTHAHTHTYIHTRTHTHMYTHTHTYTHTHMHMHTHTHTHTHTPVNVYVNLFEVHGH